MSFFLNEVDIWILLKERGEVSVKHELYSSVKHEILCSERVFFKLNELNIQGLIMDLHNSSAHINI